jgi:hypothetical protein
MMSDSNGRPVDRVMRWRGHAVGGEKVQACERQKGRDGGVQTHHDFGGAERQSNFYTNGSAGHG